MGNRWLRRGAQLGVVLAVAGSMFALPYLYSQHYPLFPGLHGCRTINDYEARYTCMAEVLIPKIREDGPERWLDGLDRMANGNIRLENDCHEAGHVIARRLVKEGGDAVDLYYTRTGNLPCTRGFQHGLLEITRAGNPAAYDTIVQKFCGETTDRNEYIDCYHGLGHAFLFEGLSPRQAAERCWSVGRLPDQVESCMDGLYMQKSADVPKMDDPVAAIESVCADVPAHEVFFCTGQATMLLHYRQYFDSSEEAQPICEQLSLPYQQDCAMMTSADLAPSELGRCGTAFSGHVLPQFCALTVTSNALRSGREAQIRSACAEHSDMRWGCGAGYSTIAARNVSGLYPDVDVVARACEELEGTTQEGCVAHAHGCWPDHSRSYTPLSPDYGACRGVHIPDRYWPHDEAGKPLEPAWAAVMRHVPESMGSDAPSWTRTADGERQARS